MKNSPVEIIKDVVLSADLSLKTISTVQEDDGNISLEVCDPSIVAPCMTLIDSVGNKHEVISIDDNVITLKPFTENPNNAISILNGISIDGRYFMHGTYKTANKELTSMYDEGLDPSTFVFLVSSPLKSKSNRKRGTEEFFINMLLLHRVREDAVDGGMSEWKTDDHYDMAINPMVAYSDKIIDEVNSRKAFDKVDTYSIDRVINIGVNKNSRKSFNEGNYSGGWLSFNLTVYNFYTPKCCDITDK